MSVLKFLSNKLLCFEDIEIFICLRLGWDCLYPRPILMGFGGIIPLNVVGHHADPQKAHPCVIPRNFSVKIGRLVTSVGESVEKI